MDPVTSYIVAGICIAGLKLAAKGLKGLFKWIRRWLSRKLKLKQFVALVDNDRELQQRLLADQLRSNPEAYRRAMQYASAVRGNQRESSLRDVSFDYDTCSDWGGDSCPESDVPDSDYELDSDCGSDEGPPIPRYSPGPKYFSGPVFSGYYYC